VKRHEVIADQIANCRRNLSKPNVIYPNGRQSHDVENEYLGRLLSELADMKIDGWFDANGRFVAHA